VNESPQIIAPQMVKLMTTMLASFLIIKLC